MTHRLLAAIACCALTVGHLPGAQAESKSRPQRVVDIAAVGDLMLGSTYPHPKSRLPPRGGTRLLAPVASVLKAADIAFGNLEGPLFDGGGKPHCTPGGIAEKNHGRPGGRGCWAFRMPSRFGRLLAAAGFDVVSLANNHIDDFGASGRAATIKVLDQLGVKHSGPTGSVARLRVGATSVHVIAFATYKGLNNMDDIAAARRLVRASARVADIVMVSFHGGAEGVRAQRVPKTRELFWGESRGAVRNFAHAMVEAGADLVVGHGPHVLRGMEFYKGRLIAYSLGTFANHRGINVRGLLGRTMILRVKLATDGTFVSGRVIPVRQRFPGGPKLDPGKATLRRLAKLSRLDFGARAVRLSADGTIASP